MGHGLLIQWWMKIFLSDFRFPGVLFLPRPWCGGLAWGQLYRRNLTYHLHPPSLVLPSLPTSHLVPHLWTSRHHNHLSIIPIPKTLADPQSPPPTFSRIPNRTRSPTPDTIKNPKSNPIIVPKPREEERLEKKCTWSFSSLPSSLASSATGRSSNAKPPPLSLWLLNSSQHLRLPHEVLEQPSAGT